MHNFFTSVDYPEINKYFDLFGWLDIRHLLVVVLYAVVLCLCFDSAVINIVFIVTFCMVAQNLCSQVVRLFYLLFFRCGLTTPEAFRTSLLSKVCKVCVFSIICAVVNIFIVKKFNNEKNLFKDRLYIILIALAFCLFAYIYNQYVSEFYEEYAPYPVVSSLLCVSLLILMSEIMRRRSIADDNEIMAGIISNSEKMRLMTEKNIDLINRKCHDLKHQMAALRLSDGALKDESLKKIEEAVNIYDSTIVTGSRVLDSLFMDKGLSCREQEIILNVCLDGTKFTFMSAVDLYVLFGNALDNAIESCITEDKVNRQINVSSSLKGGLLCVGIENSCSKNIKFKNGLPLTRKENNGYHGFGTGSIKHIVEKYGGEVTFAVYDGFFCLDMMFDLTVANSKKDS